MESYYAITGGRYKKLLVNTDLSVGGIALKCGYDNAYYFSNAFQHQTAYRLSEYKKINRI